MGWLRERKQIGVDLSSGVQNIIPIDPFGGRQNLNGMLYPDSSYTSFALNGFTANELVYACIMEKAQSLPQGIVRVYPMNGAEPLEDHRLRRLLQQPNPITTEFEFLELSVVYLDLSGNCYWLIVRARDGLPAQLWPLRPDLVRILPSSRPGIFNYGYIIDPTTGARGAPSEVIPIPFEDVIQIKYPNPLDAYFGLSPLRPAARATSLDNGATDFIDTLLRNDATPRTVITTVQKVDEELIELLKSKWMARFSGARRGSPAFLQQGMDVKVLGMKLDELEFPELRSGTEARICMALGVPPILIGAKVGLDRSTFSNYREARAAFWEETLMPLQRRFIEPIRTRLVPEFSGVGRQTIRADWDNSEVLALREAESAKWERATNALARGGITINDFRDVVGLDAATNGDVFLTPAGVTPMSADEPIPTPDAQPQLQAASYADRFLADLSHNGKEHPANV